MGKNEYRIIDRGSRSTSVLEQAWQELRSIVPKLPRVIFTLVNASNGNRVNGSIYPNQWTHNTGSGKRHELAISPMLFGSPKSTLVVLLHEAAHALLLKEVHAAGCGPDGYYHRKEFRDMARRLGLTCEFRNGRYGWTNTGWAEKTLPAVYEPVLAILRTLPKGTGHGSIGVPRRRQLPDAGQIRLTCACEVRRSVYVPKSMLPEPALM